MIAIGNSNINYGSILNDNERTASDTYSVPQQDDCRYGSTQQQQHHQQRPLLDSYYDTKQQRRIQQHHPSSPIKILMMVLFAVGMTIVLMGYGRSSNIPFNIINTSMLQQQLVSPSTQRASNFIINDSNAPGTTHFRPFYDYDYSSGRDRGGNGNGNSNDQPTSQQQPQGDNSYHQWRAWALRVRDYWADQQQAWEQQKAALQAKNATKVEIKVAKTNFWNSTVNKFDGGGGVGSSSTSMYYNAGNDDDE